MPGGGGVDPRAEMGEREAAEELARGDSVAMDIDEGGYRQSWPIGNNRASGPVPDRGTTSPAHWGVRNHVPIGNFIRRPRGRSIPSLPSLTSLNTRRRGPALRPPCPAFGRVARPASKADRSANRHGLCICDGRVSCAILHTREPHPMDRTKPRYEVFENFMLKLQILGFDKQAEAARAAVDGFAGEHEIFAVFVTREKFNPVSDYVSTLTADDDCRTVAIPTSFSGFVYVRCGWDAARRGAFIGRVLGGAAHVRTSH